MIVVEMTRFLKLTEALVAELKPLLEDSFKQLGEMLDRLAQEGTKKEEFKNQYRDISKDLLSGEQASYSRSIMEN